MARSVRPKLGEILLETGHINRSQLNRALAIQKEDGERLGRILVKEGYVSENEIINVLESQFGIPRLNLDKVAVDMEVVKLLPPSLIKRYRVMPISRIGPTIIRMAMVDPLNIFAIDDVQIVTGMDIEPGLVTEEEMDKLIDIYIDKGGDIDHRTAFMFGQSGTDLPGVGDSYYRKEVVTIRDDADDAPVVKLINTIIREAVRQRSSDIHIEPMDNCVRIRFRVDGTLYTAMTVAKSNLPGMVSRVKILAGMDITERRVPQDGRVEMDLDGRKIDLRISTLPTVIGEKVAIRVLDKNKVNLNLSDLGFLPENLKKFEELISQPYGMILVSGPTGSGKTTTLYAALNDLNSEDKNIITFEDPVEYMLHGVNQVGINNKTGLTFAVGLRSFLRQDPNIIMVGEVRDRETASIAIQAALTGHLVLSTIHTNDAPGTLTRLLDMGIEEFLIASSVVGVVSQRLVRRICPDCKKLYKGSYPSKSRVDPLLALGLNISQGIELHQGKGCSNCNHTGYRGMLALQEVMLMSDTLRDLTIKRASSDEIRRAAIAEGMKSLKQDGIFKILTGLTTPEEVMRAVYSIEGV